jgi:hypothetical protein
MFSNPTFQIFCQARVICIIRAAKNINGVWHRCSFVRGSTTLLLSEEGD